MPPDELTQTLKYIAEILPTYGSFRISHTEIGYYYHLNDVTYHRVNNKLFLKIKIPLTTTTTSFTLYRINTVPIPIGPDRQEHSLIQLKKPYLVISKDNLFYVTLSENEYHFCVGNQLKTCSQALSMQETGHPDCALALFNDQPQLVSKLCDVNFIPATNYSQSHIITISENSYLISSQDTHLIQTCPGRTPIHISPCKLCTISLPCACSLKGQTFFIPPSLQNCLPHQKPVVSHSLNLPALLHFYEDTSKLINLTSKSSFLTPVKSNLPNIDLINKKYKDVIEQPSSTLSLASIARNVKESKQMYVDKVSKLQSDLGILSQPEVNTGISILSCLTCIIAVLALAMSLNVYCKMLVLARVAKAYELPPLEVEESKDSVMTYVMQEYMMVMISLVIMCAVIVMVCLLYHFWKKSSQLFTQIIPHTVVSIVLFGNGDCMKFQLLKTSIPILNLKLAVPDEPQNLVQPTVSLIFRTLHVNWHSLSLLSKDQLVLNFPSTVTVKFLKLGKLSKILSDLSEIQMILSTPEEYLNMHTWFTPVISMQTINSVSKPPSDCPDALPQEHPDNQ